MCLKTMRALKYNLELRRALTFAGLELLNPNELHKGHIPNSVNIHYPRFSDPVTRCFIKPKQLEKCEYVNFRGLT